MKKYISITIILLIVTILLSGCGEQNNSSIVEKEQKVEENKAIEQNENASVNVDNIYSNVLRDETKYVSEENKKMLFSEYMSRYEGKDAKIEYCLFDFDRDNENEMIIRISSFDGFYLILNYEDGTVYGFEDVYRGMTTIKEDGTYVGSGGADVHAICRCTFEKNKRIVEELASSDWGKYKVNNKNASKGEYDAVYKKECESKKDIEFKNYTDKYEYKSNENSQIEQKTQTNENTSSFKEGKYTMIKPSLKGTEAEGYDTTVTFNGGKADFSESYWMRKKTGTYSVSGDTLTIRYTSGNEVSSIEGDLGTRAINETETYKIDGNKITIQSTTADSYTKAGDIVYELK